MSQTIKIGTKREESTFQNHLVQDDNHRIIFSAPFGSGKTTFIKNFFEKHSSEYEYFHIYPVNYSVASNEDIFELIKFDILFHLLGKGLNFEKITIPMDISFSYFIQNNPENILMPFIRQIPTIGKQIAEIGKEIIDLYKQFELKHTNNQIDQEKTVIKYLEEITKTKGSVKEEDFYTQLICELSEQLKKTNSDKKTVLIIDDLDRIDPDHIFRILNVFSAHFDIDSNKNKFDFDKIILVCDINNIRKIYSNRYGQDVDFSGYIDKFFSKKVFYFDIISEVEEKLAEIFLSITFRSSRETHFLYGLRDHVDIRFILYIIFSNIKSGFLPLRKILKFISEEIVINEQRESPRINGRYFSTNDFRFLIVHKALKTIFNDFNSFKNNLEFLNDNSKLNPYANYKSEYINLLIPFLTYQDHSWDLKLNENKKGTYPFGELKLEWEIKVKEKDRSYNTNIDFEISYKFLNNQNEIPLESIDVFSLTKRAIEIIEKNKLNWLE